MGMFDTIKYKFKGIPLPIPLSLRDGFSSVPEEYQTKDFDCCLDILEIREDGKLYRKSCEYDAMYRENPESAWDKLPILKEKNVKWEFLKITNTIDIHTFVCNEDNYDYWLSYDITFIDGKVSNVKLTEFKKEDNQNRKNTAKELNEYYNRLHELSKTKRYKYLYNPYNNFIFKTCNFLSKFLNKLASYIFVIEKKLMIKF